MLNLTSIKIRIERGKGNATKFDLGVSIIVFFQAYGSVLLTKYLNSNPDFIIIIKKITVLTFAILSLYFFRENKREKKPTNKFTEKCKNSFISGLILSALNMFAIPFYYAIITFLMNEGLFDLSQKNIILFSVGSAIGTFILLYLYPNLAKIVPKPKNSSNKMNLVLSVLTGVFALVAFIEIY